MALDKDELGLDLYNVRMNFSNKTMDELIAIHGSLENIWLAACKADAEAIINHIKAKGKVSGNVSTTGTATTQSGSITTNTTSII